MKSVMRDMLKVSAVLSAGVILVIGSAGVARADVIFDNTPSPLPSNVPSQPYQAQQTSEFWQRDQLCGDRGPQPGKC